MLVLDDQNTVFSKLISFEASYELRPKNIRLTISLVQSNVINSRLAAKHRP